MEIALDTLIVNHLLRVPSASRRGRRIVQTTALDPHIRQRRLVIGIDPDEAIIDEWRRTCGAEMTEQLVTHWNDLNGFLSLNPLAQVPVATSRRLLQLGFGRKTIDKLLVRIALSIDDRIIVSEDCDFWRPGNYRRLVGNPKAPVAYCLRKDLGIDVVVLTDLLARLHRMQ